MSKDCHPKTINLVRLILAMKIQHSTGVANAIHLKERDNILISTVGWVILKQGKGGREGWENGNKIENR